MLGMHGAAYANFAIQEADLIVAIGSRFDDRTTGVLPKYAPEAKKAHDAGTGTDAGRPTWPPLTVATAQPHPARASVVTAVCTGSALLRGGRQSAVPFKRGWHHA